MYIFITAFLLLLACGLVLGFVIGLAAKIFAVESDPRVEEVTEMLPGANCGGCGKAGCTDFAKAVAQGEISPDTCPVCSAETVQKIASLLGIEAGGGDKKVAVILCGGSNSKAETGTPYNGVMDCISANMIAGGPKACSFGCLGLATCARACPFGAIEIIDGLAFVHNDLCVGCGKCVDACPRKIIKLVPAKADVHVYCNSPAKGAAKKKDCAVACIGCRKCVKASEDEQMKIEGFLASVNYANPPGIDIIEKAGCPTGCLKEAGSKPEAVTKAKEEVA